MPRQSVFEWKDGAGWLVLSGSVDLTSAVRGHAIERAAADGGVACVVLGGAASEADDMLNDMQELGAPSSFVVDVITEDDATIRKQIGEASIVLVRSHDDPRSVLANLKGAPLEGIEKAYERGAVIVAEGTVPSVFGESIFDGSGLVDGLQWVRRVFVVPNLRQLDDFPPSQLFMQQQPQGIVLGLGAASAMVFGGVGRVETWGAKNVSIVLGQAYSQS